MAGDVEVAEVELPRALGVLAGEVVEGDGQVPIVVAERQPELHDGQLVDIVPDQRVPLVRGEVGVELARGREVDGARVLRVHDDVGEPREQRADLVELRVEVDRRDRLYLDGQDVRRGLRDGAVVREGGVRRRQPRMCRERGHGTEGRRRRVPEHGRCSAGAPRPRRPMLEHG